MKTVGQAFRRGKLWTARVMKLDEGDEADFRFWYEGLTPAERVEAVHECLLDHLRTRGIRGTPRLRRVSRLLKR